MDQTTDWARYLAQMEQLLIQLERIAALAAPLMAFPLDERLEVAGVFHP